MLLHVLLLPLSWLILRRWRTWPKRATALFYHFLLVLFFSFGLVIHFFRYRKAGIRNWFLYYFVGTGNLVYGTGCILVFLIVHPEYTIIVNLLALFMGYCGSRKTFSRIWKDR